MTISVLSAALFSLMTHCLPTASGKPVIGVPSPELLGKPGSSSSSDSEEESSEDSSSTPDLKQGCPEQVSLGSWNIPSDENDFDSDAATLVLGEHTQDQIMAHRTHRSARFYGSATVLTGQTCCGLE